MLAVNKLRCELRFQATPAVHLSLLPQQRPPMEFLRRPHMAAYRRHTCNNSSCSSFKRNNKRCSSRLYSSKSSSNNSCSNSTSNSNKLCSAKDSPRCSSLGRLWAVGAPLGISFPVEPLELCSASGS